MHLSKYDKFNFVVLEFYHTPFKSYGHDYNPTTDIEDWCCMVSLTYGQATILDQYAIESRYCINILMSVNVPMTFHEEITEIVKVVVPERNFARGK